MEAKTRSPYANLKTAKREPKSKAAVGASILCLLQTKVTNRCPKPPKIRVPRIVGRGIEGRQDGTRRERSFSQPRAISASINQPVVKETTVAKEVATPSRKRKAAEDLEEVSAAVSDVTKKATSTIYKKRKVEAGAKAETVADTKRFESEPRASLGKKMAAHALEGNAAGTVHGDDAPSAKKRRREDWPVVKTEPLEEKMPVPSGEKKAKDVKDDEVFVPQDVHPRVANM